MFFVFRSWPYTITRQFFRHAIFLPSAKKVIAGAPIRPLAVSVIAFRYYGGKNSHLSWLLPLLPEDDSVEHYVEPSGRADCEADSVKIRLPNVGPTNYAIYDEHLLEIVCEGLRSISLDHRSKSFVESYGDIFAWCEDLEKSINGPRE